MRKQDVLEYLEDAYSFLMDPAIGRAIDEIKRLRAENAVLLKGSIVEYYRRSVESTQFELPLETSDAPQL